MRSRRTPAPVVEIIPVRVLDKAPGPEPQRQGSPTHAGALRRYTSVDTRDEPSSSLACFQLQPRRLAQFWATPDPPSGGLRRRRPSAPAHQHLTPNPPHHLPRQQQPPLARRSVQLELQLVPADALLGDDQDLHLVTLRASKMHVMSASHMTCGSGGSVMTYTGSLCKSPGRALVAAGPKPQARTRGLGHTCMRDATSSGYRLGEP